MQRFQGIKVSAGIVIGPVEMVDSGTLGLSRIVNDPFRERALYEAAIILAKDELRLLQQRAKGPQTDILSFQIALLEDESFTNEIGDYIAAGAGSAAAVERAEQIFAARLGSVDDEYIQQRSIDVRDACRRVVDILDGRQRRRLHLTRPSILVADQFFPSDLFALDRRMILGLASERDSMASHAAIMARTMGIPAVFRLGPDVAHLADGHQAVLDGHTGTLVIDPTPQALAQAVHAAQSHRLTLLQRSPLLDKPSRTADGTPFLMLTSASNVEDIEAGMRLGAGGIGLVRTERVALTHMSEERQYFTYLNCLAAARDAPVTVRTCDAGADDGAPWVQGVQRLANNRRSFDAQICALLRAAVHGDLGIALPMITGVEDWHRAMTEIEACKARMRAEKIEFDERAPIGCMIDVPSAAMAAESLLQSGARFLVVDIDDLTRYTCGRSRKDDPDTYRVDDPAVLRLVGDVMAAAARYHAPAGICGITELELPAIPAYLRLGVRYFCTENACVLPLKALLIRQDLREKPADLPCPGRM